MSYSVEWMGFGVVPVYVIVLAVLIVPEFAAIAVVVATIGVLVAVVALAAAALASPFLLVRSARRRPRPTYPRRERDPGADRPQQRLRVVGGTHVTGFARDERIEAAPILEDATRDAA